MNKQNSMTYKLIIFILGKYIKRTRYIFLIYFPNIFIYSKSIHDVNKLVYNIIKYY